QPMHGETRSPRRAWVAAGALLAGLGLAAAPAGAQPGMRKSVPAVPKRAPTRTVIVTEPAPPARVVAPAATAQPVTPAAPAAPAAPPGLGTAAALSDIAQPAPGDLFQRKPGMWDPAPLWSYLDPVLEDGLAEAVRGLGLQWALDQHKLALALVDITDVRQPRVAALNGDRMLYAASLQL